VGLSVEALDIDPHIEDKLWVKHSVAFEEVEDVCYDDGHRAERTRAGLYLVLGRSAAGRYLAVILAFKGGGLWKVVSAREMNDAERRRYQRR
jgi:uncharacterized DUF497 family protein